MSASQSRHLRRDWLRHAAAVLAVPTLGTASANRSAGDETNNVAPRRDLRFPNFEPKAKRVIFLFMSGGPSHVDTFDPKPALKRYDGQPIPAEYVKDVHFAMIPDATKQPKLKASPFQFRQRGNSGIPVSDLFPNTGRIVDRLAVIRSVHSSIFNHDPAVNLVNTGDSRVGRPTLGAWLSFGLGNEADDLPAYVVLTSGVKLQPLLTSYWSNGFLPAQHQGVEFRNRGEPLLFLDNPDGVTFSERAKQLALLKQLNSSQHELSGDPKIPARTRQFELAYRMQQRAPDVVDLSQETEATLNAYGAAKESPSFSRNCLLARRLVESGVRFVQLYDMGWDAHGGLVENHRRQCAAVDQPIAALIRDLDQRGLLDETLVVWGGEFGRTPVVQGDGEQWGRDHHPHGFTMWMAGGGIKPGLTYGETDELGFHSVEDRVDIHDIHATILHQMGIDHKALVYRFQGRDFRLTDVSGRVLKTLLA